MAEVLDRLLREADSDGSQSFTFDEFLELIARVRAHSRTSREARLRREFGRYVKMQQGGVGMSNLYRSGNGQYSDEDQPSRGDVAAAIYQHVRLDANPDYSVDVDRLYALLNSVGLSGKTSAERELVHFTISASCETAISFPAFEELCQSICEILVREEVQEQYANAEALGINNYKLYKYQAAFDHVRTKDHPTINTLDLPKVLAKLLVRPPPKADVEIMLEQLNATDIQMHEISFLTFLQLMTSMFAGSVQLVKEIPFTLKNVSDKKLREILRMFPLASEYIEEVTVTDLPELVGSFLGMRAATDLREMYPPMSNIRQLLTYAQKKSATRMESKQPDALIGQMELAVRQNQLKEQPVEPDNTRVMAAKLTQLKDLPEPRK